MPRADDDLSSLVGHAAPPEQQRLRLQSSMRWHASRVFMLACAPVFVPVALLLWFTRRPQEWEGGWLPPALALLIAGLALLSAARERVTTTSALEPSSSVASLMIGLSVGRAASNTAVRSAAGSDGSPRLTKRSGSLGRPSDLATSSIFSPPWSRLRASSAAALLAATARSCCRSFSISARTSGNGFTVAL